MKFIKKNIKLIIGIIVGMILVSGLSVYAAYSYLASDVSYTKPDGTETNVQDALSELYLNKNQTTPAINKIFYSDENSVDYTYTTTHSGRYLAVILECNNANVASISTTGNEIINNLSYADNYRKSIIKLIECEEGDTIALKAKNGEKYLTSFIYEIEDINVYNIDSMNLSVDTTATLNYTADKDNRKVIYIAMVNGGTRNNPSVNFTNENCVKASNQDTYVKVGYAILNKGDQISMNAYGYNWGGGATYIIK